MARLDLGETLVEIFKIASSYGTKVPLMSGTQKYELDGITVTKEGSFGAPDPKKEYFNSYSISIGNGYVAHNYSGCVQRDRLSDYEVEQTLTDLQRKYPAAKP